MIADIVDGAALTAAAIPQFTTRFELGLDDAHAAQADSIDRRLERGERLGDVKTGPSSRAKVTQVDVGRVIWGRLTDAVVVTMVG